MKGITIVRWVRGGSSVAENELDFCAVCATRFVDLLRNALAFGLLIKKSHEKELV